MLGISLGMAQRAVASGNRVFEILDREPRIESAPDAPPLPDGPGAVELRDVSLAYNGGAPALEDVELKVERGPNGGAGRSIGVGEDKPGRPPRAVVRPDPRVGARGRRRPADRGRAARCARRSRSSPTTASCSPRRWPRTSPTRTRSATQEEIETAARRAQAHGFIESLPDGYATLVGERGLTLSGGQRQRIAIARALLADPRILILDDATSSVDARTEAAIKRGLREVMAGRTTFIVAHRMSTISLADEIVVMDGGTIVDRGSHEELLERCPLYAEIAEHGMADSVFLQRDLERREEVARSVTRERQAHPATTMR